MNKLAIELQATIQSVCEKHGFYFYGLNGFEEDDGAIKFVFTTAAEERKLSQLEKDRLIELGLDSTKLENLLYNVEDRESYFISGLNYDNPDLPVVIKNKATNKEHYCSIEKANSMRQSED